MGIHDICASLCRFLIITILVCSGSSAGCRRISRPEAAAPDSSASSVAPAPPDPEPQPDPEIARQIQQVSEALSKGEAALQVIYEKKKKAQDNAWGAAVVGWYLQVIYEKKKKAQGVLTGMLQDFLDGDSLGQSSKMDRANDILRDQNKSKCYFAKWQSGIA